MIGVLYGTDYPRIHTSVSD